MKKPVLLVFLVTCFASIIAFAANSRNYNPEFTAANWLNGPTIANQPGETIKIKPIDNTSYTAISPASSIDFSLVGYATLTGGTTGGAGGRSITVTTGTELQNALKAKIKETTPLTIYVAGKITPENSPGLSKIDVKELKDVSILGLGTSGEFDGIGIKIYKASNVIVRNVKVHHVRIGDKDCISIEGPSDHIWIDHCELYNEFQGVGKDYYDALLDAKANSEYITISWNYFHDSWKASLSGSSESDTYDRKITYHHNYFRNLNSRLPLFRGGNGHVFNNYYKDIAETAINSRINACLKIENNYFLNANNPYVSAYSNVVGYGDISGNILINSPFKYTADEKELGPCVSNTPYAYANVLHTAEEVPAIVEQYAGVGVIDVTADGGGDPTPQPVTYQLTTSVTGQGSVSPSSGTYAEGATGTLTATPAAGWAFSNWSGDASGTTNPLTLLMNSAKAVSATFIQTTTGGDGGTTPGGSAITITATTPLGTGLCSFDGSLRTPSGTSGGPVINLPNTAGKGVNWKVEVPAAGEYQLKWRYAGGGSSAQETARLKINGIALAENIAFPKPKDSNSYLTTASITVNLGNGVNEIRLEVIHDLAMGDIEWIEVTGNSPVASDCTLLPVGSGGSSTPATYTLAATSSPANGGTVTFSPAGGTYDEGTTVTATATPAAGWQFSGWSGDATGTANTAAVLMNGNKTLTATFTQTSSGGGPSATITATASPANGLCSFDGSLRGVGSSFVINLSNAARKGITWKVAAPEAGNYIMTWRYAGGGSSAAETAKLIVNGSTVLASVAFPKPAGSTSFLVTAPVTIALAKGVNEIRIETTESAAFADIEWIKVEGNSPVAANCTSGEDEDEDPSAEMYTLSATSSPANGGTITFSPEGGTYEDGTYVTVTATPAAGWLFSGWSGDASGTENTAEVSMSKDKAVIANFYQITTERIVATALPADGLCSFDGSLRAIGTTSVINLSNTAGKGVNWKVEVPAAGNYEIVWRYAGGGSSAQETARLLVNGVVVNDAVAFPKPAGSTSFLNTTPLKVALGSGVNEIRIEVIQSAAMGDIEWVEVTGNGPKATDCSNEVGSGGGGTPVPATYTLAATRNPSNGGTVTFSPAGGTYNDGTQVTVTAAPASGYSFAGWSGDAGGSATSATVVMNSNKSVTATFTLDTTDPDPNPGPSIAGMSGYATVSGEGRSTTTGGQGGQIITITTLTQLQTWAASREKNTRPEIVHISGKITASSTTVVTIKHGENVSVIGLGNTAELVNVGLNFRNYKNVIVRNLKIHEVFYPNDALTIDECQHVWVDHNEFHSKIGAGIGVDTYDGLLDIKNGSRYVTVSYNYFHDHMKTVLIGHTDNSNAEAIDRQIRVTFHHNYFENTNSRNPSLRWGAAHLFNNYFKNVGDYGLAARQGAYALVENNVYENVKTPLTNNKFDGLGNICERGNLFTGTSGSNSITQTGCDWWNATTLPYAYTLDDVNTLASTLPGKVGVGKLDATDDGGTTDPQPVTYQLTTSVTGQGEVTSGDTYNEGTTTEIIATPAAGWQFSGWSGDASGNTNPLAVTMNSSKAIEATFTQITHQLMTSVIGQGEVTSGDTYNEGATTEITATPAAGWQFSGWSGDATGTDNPLAVTIGSNKAIVATFTEIMYQLTTSHTGRGSINSPDGAQKAGTAVTLTATPDAGWQFSGWSGDASGTDNPLQVKMEGDKTIAAAFTEIEYQLSAVVNGQGSLSFANSTYTHQRTVTLTATPAAGWKFTGWSGDATGTTNPLTVVMDADKSLIANFARIDYNLSVAVQGQGSVNVSQGTYNEGETVLLTATPAPGWQFDGWSGDANGTAGMLALTMTSDKAVTANFSHKGGNAVAPSGKAAMAKVYPNPYKGSATFEFTLTEKSKVKIALYTFNGIKVADILSGTQTFDTGTHSILYTNALLKSGVYIYVIETETTIFRDQLLVE